MPLDVMPINPEVALKEELKFIWERPVWILNECMP